MALDVFHHDNGVIHDQSHRQHNRENRQQIETKAQQQHHHRCTQQGHRHRHERHHRRAHRAHEQEHDHRDDEHRFHQRLADFFQRVAHEHRGVVREFHLDVRGQRGPNALHLREQTIAHFDFVRTRQRPDAEINRLLLAVVRNPLGFFRAEFYVGNVRQTHNRAVAFGHDQVLKIFDSAEVRVCKEIDLNQIALRLAHCREVIVASQRCVNIARRQVLRRQLIGINPHAHRNRSRALEADALHAGERGKLRLQRARQPIGDRRHVALFRRETDVERRIRPVCALDFNDGRLGFSGQFRAHLLQSRGDFRQRRRAVVIQLQPHGHDAHASATGGFEIIDAADRRHDALNGRGEKATHGFRARTGVNGRNQHRRTFDAWILLNRQRGQRAPADQNDDEVDHNGQHGVLDENISNRAHGISLSAFLVGMRGCENATVTSSRRDWFPAPSRGRCRAT